MSKSPTKSKKNLSNEQDTPKIKNTEPVSPSHDAKVDPEPQHSQVDNEQQQPEEAMGVVERFENNPQPQLEDEEENREVPSDKDQLIEYLKETLKRAEMTMGTVFVAIEIEKEKRTKLVDEINEKKSEIDEINAEENNFLSEKVNEKMATALQRALEDKDIAESEHAESQQKVDELETRIKELDENVQSVHLEKAQREAGILDTQYKVNEQDSMIDSYNVELEKLSNKNKERANKINNLTTEIDDMKSIIESLSNARIKLNHYLKDETPTQSRQGARNARTPQGVRPDVRNSGERYASGEDAQLFELTTTPTKPNAPPADDDFWYSEAKNKFRGNEQQQRRVESQEPWQPKVQYYELPAKTPEYNQGNTVKLPNINNGRPEYLYKSKEYNDEFANTNQRTVKKGQVQAQQQKRRF